MGLQILKEDGKIVSEEPQKANILNDQFQSVFTAEPEGNVPSLGNSPHNQINYLTITKAGVEKLLNGLNINISQGPDGIPPWFLKIGAQ